MKTREEERAAPPSIADDASTTAAGAVRSGADGYTIRPARNSLLRHSPALVLLAILVADSNRHTDPDLWGHIRFGQAFIASRHLIHNDPYNYSAPGTPWHDYEWLGEVVMAFAYNAAGVAGLKLWKFVCTVFTVVFVADSEAETGASSSTQLVVLMVAALGLVLQMQFRPQMFTFVLLGVLLALLARDNYRGHAPLWTAVPLMAVWANLHGGWIIGVATLAVYTAVATIHDVVAGAGFRRGIRLSAITGSGVLATLLNPYGCGIWRAVGWALLAPYKRLANVEWQPMFFALSQQWQQSHSGIFVYAAVLALMVGLAVAFFLAPDGRDLPLVAIAAMMCVGAWLSVRNMGLVAVTTSAPLARHLDLLAQRWRSEAPASTSRPVNQLGIVVLCVALMLKTSLFSRRLDLDQPYPAGALTFMRTHQLSGRILNDWNWGDYLIWHAAPASKVFIDGRDDTVYPLEVVRHYLLFRFDLQGASRVLDAYPHDYVLISRSAQARHLMERRHDWKLLYRDDSALLYARASAPAASLPDLPVIGAPVPGAFP